MPRFYFHIQNDTYHPDTKGSELTDCQDAEREAMLVAGEALANLPASFWHSGDESQMTVVDEQGDIVVTLWFAGSAKVHRPANGRRRGRPGGVVGRASADRLMQPRAESLSH